MKMHVDFLIWKAAPHIQDQPCVGMSIGARAQAAV